MALINLKVNLDTKTTSTQLSNLEKQIQGLGRSFSTASRGSNLNSLQKQTANLLTSIKNIQNRYPEKTFEALAASVRGTLNDIKSLNKDGVEVTDEKLVELTKKTREQTTEFATLKAETEQVTTAVVKQGDSIGKLAQKFVLWQAAATLVMQPLQKLRQAWSSLNETLQKTEDTVIALQRVLPSGSASDSEISTKLYKLARDYGQTFENVSEIATNFARTGMSWTDTINATEAALLALNVAELDASEASDGLIAIMTQFHYSASQLTDVIDMLNKTADNFPVTSEKLLTALQRTGSSADNANLTLSETIGLITALSQATGRSGENLGTAVNSLIQYSSKSSSLDTFASLGGDVEAVVEKYRKGGATILDVWTEVSKVIQNMSAEQEKILAGMDVSDLNQELQDELGDIFETISDVYGTANTFRKNYFIALLGNMQTVMDAAKTAEDSIGYSQEENLKYLDTYTAKVNSLKAQWQELANDEQGFLKFKKGLVEIGTSGLAILQKLGGIQSVIIPTAAAMSAMFSTKILASGKTLTQMFKSWGTALRHPLKTLQEYSATLKSLHQAQVLQTEAEEEQNRVTQLYIQAREQQAVAAEIAAQAEEASAAASAAGGENEALNTAATEWNTLAKEQQTLATNLQINAEKAQAAAAMKTAVAEQALAAASKTSGAAASSAAGIWGLLAFAIYEVLHVIGNAIQEAGKAEEEERKRREELISTADAAISSTEQETDAIFEYIKAVNEAGGAQDTLLTIQKQIISSNKELAGTLDLVNGELSEQQELLEDVAKQKLRDWVQDNKEAIETARIAVEESGTSTNNATSEAIANKLAQITGQDITNDYNWWDKTSWYEYLLVVPGAIKTAGRVVTGKQDAVGGALDFVNALGDLFTGHGSQISDTQYGISLSGTTEEKISYLRELYNKIEAKGISEYGMSVDEVKDALLYISNTINSLNTDTYKESVDVYNYYEKVLRYLNGEITYFEFINGYAEDVIDSTDNWRNSLDDVAGKYEDILSKLKEIFDVQEASYELEEKKRALEQAMSERTTRQYNEATGQWEWAANERNIASARKDLQDVALNQLKNIFEDGVNVDKKTRELVESIDDYLPKFVTQIADIISQASGVNIQLPVKETNGVSGSGGSSGGTSVYDSGGVLRGLGGIKATEEDEVILSPDIAKKILTPTTNAQFSAFARDLGLLFGASHEYANTRTQVVSNFGGATNNYGGNYYINGVPITQEMASKFTVTQLVEQMELLTDK